MKNRWYTLTFVMIAGFIVILLVSGMMGNAGMTSLGKEYEGLSESREFAGQILWEGAEQPVTVLLTDDQFRWALSSGEIKEREAFEGIPSPRFQISFRMAGEAYDCILGRDGGIRITDESGDSRYFLDRTGSIFRALYEEHQLSGGGKLPEDIKNSVS